jgi:hypothetical protein
MPKVEKNQKNIEDCACTRCPSYNECAKGKKEILYCAREIGKSSCKYEMNGCVCGACVVHNKCNLKSGYYCIKGSAEEVDGKI